MAGISFTTAGDGKQHYLSEKLGFIDSNAPLCRVVIRNDAYNNSGTSIIGGSGPLGVGVERMLSLVMLVPSTTLVDSITVHNTNISDITWNDYGKVCQLSVTWNYEPAQATGPRSTPVPLVEK